MSTTEVQCRGCGLVMPRSALAAYDGYYNTSAECWSVYTEVLAAEYGNAMLFGQVHQLTVDAYAVQHAGGPHPDKSIGVHLSGLQMVLERGVAPMAVPAHLQRMAEAIRPWPHFEPPAPVTSITVFDVAMAGGAFADHVAAVRRWATAVWQAWTPHHAAVAELVARRAEGA